MKTTTAAARKSITRQIYRLQARLNAMRAAGGDWTVGGPCDLLNKEIAALGTEVRILDEMVEKKTTRREAEAYVLALVAA